MSKLIGKTTDPTTGSVLNTLSVAASSRTDPGPAPDRVAPSDEYARTSGQEGRGSSLPKRVHARPTEAPRLTGGGSVDFAALHGRLASPNASRQAAESDASSGVISVESKAGDIVGASLDGIPITQHNFRRLEGLRTSSKDGGETWQSEWRSVIELENKPGIGMRVRTVDGLGSSVDQVSLRWRSE